MPKHQAKKKRKAKQRQRQNVLGAEEKAPGGEDLLRKAIQPLLIQLADDAPDVQHLACNTLAHITADPDNHASAVELGVKESLRKVLYESDNVFIQCEAAGCFRNLATCEDDTMLAIIFDDDTQSCLGNILVQRVAEIDTMLESDDQDLKFCFFNLLTQVCKIFSLLCEQSPVFVDNLSTASPILCSIASCMRANVLPVSLSSAAASCMLILSEENPTFSRWLTHNTALDFTNLQKLLSLHLSKPQYAEFCLTVAGILVNAGVSFSLEGCLSHIVAAISTALSQDISVELDDFIGILPQARQADHDGLCSPQREKLETAFSMMRAQCVGLELLTNMLCLPEDCNEGEPNLQVQEQLSNLFAELKANDISNKAINLCHPLSPKTHECFTVLGEWGTHYLAQQCKLLHACLNFFHNLFQVEPLDIMHVDGVYGIWNTLFLLFQHPDEAVAQSACMSGWALLRAVLLIDQLRQTLAIPQEQIDLVAMLVVGRSQEEDMRIACVGILACVAQLASSAQFLTRIGKVIAHTALKDRSLCVRLEAVNAVFDAFAEPETNDHYVNSGLVEAVANLKPQLKSEPGTPEDVSVRLEDTIVNLQHFLQYKSEQ